MEGPVARNPDGSSSSRSTTRTWDLFGRLLEESATVDLEAGSTLDASNRTATTSYETNLLGWTLAATVSSGGLSAKTLTEYDKLGRAIATWDPNDSGNPDGTPSATVAYTARGKEASREGRDGARTTFEYDGFDQLIRMTDPRGNHEDYEGDYSASYRYDDAGRIVLQTLPKRSLTDLASVLTFLYDARGAIEKRTEIDGSTTSYEYDGRGLLSTETRKDKAGTLSIVTSYLYDDSGNPTKAQTGGQQQPWKGQFSKEL